MRARTRWCCRLRMIYYARRRDDDSGANQKRWTAGRREKKLGEKSSAGGRVGGFVFEYYVLRECRNFQILLAHRISRNIVLLYYMYDSRVGAFVNISLRHARASVRTAQGGPSGFHRFPALISRENHEVWITLYTPPSGLMRERVYVAPYIMRPIARDFPRV